MSDKPELTGMRHGSRGLGSDLHDLFFGVVITKPTDFEPSGFRSREEEDAWDCSTGCKWFYQLQGKVGLDWGVCANPLSPRSGLLTFEHQGCFQFEAGEVNVGSLEEEVASLAQQTSQG